MYAICISMLIRALTSSILLLDSRKSDDGQKSGDEQKSDDEQKFGIGWNSGDVWRPGRNQASLGGRGKFRSLSVAVIKEYSGKRALPSLLPWAPSYSFPESPSMRNKSLNISLIVPAYNEEYRLHAALIEMMIYLYKKKE
ncbi:hypothetical protein IEQ34_016043 [Dendrobium chrysotoxum]|uniref:Uncharacterized protein n=1 Tax=Dendrobium chrysotoxum TaxID=161865 RepID=A0AAV7GDZ2_DENCH|nr:hypothetical protein IEQ34_016043 [Dendrobium chrysotoxum]